MSTSEGKVTQKQLTGWMQLFAVMMELLERWNLVEATSRHVTIDRKDGYTSRELLAFATALFCAQMKRPAIGAFCRKVVNEQLREELAAISGMTCWPSQPAISRLLSSVSTDDCDHFRQHVMSLLPQRWPAWLRDMSSLMDSRGGRWIVVDLDGVVRNFRERALPVDASIPPARRRATAPAAAGHPGRKRGEKQVSSNRLHHRGSGMLMLNASVPGNAVMSEGVELAVQELVRWSEAARIPPERIIIRMDGAGGNAPCAENIRKAGMQFIARCANYRLLEEHAFIQRLCGPVWFPVGDGMTGPVRHAAELCTAPLGKVKTRMVISAFRSKDGTKHGAGQLIGDTQFEHFGTSLPQEDFAPEDIVELYFNRGGGENDYAVFNHEFGVDHHFSDNIAGQDLMIQMAMLVSNVQTIAAMSMQKPLPSSTVVERTRQPVLLDEPELETLTTPPPPPPPPPPLSPSPSETARPRLKADLTALNEDQVEDIRRQLKPGWSWDAGEIHCPNGKTLRLHGEHTKADGNTHIAMRSTARECRACPRRNDCTRSLASTFRKEVWCSIRGEIPRHALLPIIATGQTPPTVASMPDCIPGLTATESVDDTLPRYIKPGNARLGFPTPIPSSLRAWLRMYVGGVESCITFQPHPPGRPRRHPFAATVPAERKNQRHTHEQRRTRYKTARASLTTAAATKLTAVLHAN